ncbi:unnamed protein product [Arctia plantaginis]|uniref:Uncharacterized protein n=1 Tax=Arctia plantaginis TaxID=874455 RepID=A0A8S1A0H2_ARCPL|nr:unnamed protein product [Arctia plantaginis]
MVRLAVTVLIVLIASCFAAPGDRIRIRRHAYDFGHGGYSGGHGGFVSRRPQQVHLPLVELYQGKNMIFQWSAIQRIRLKIKLT